MSEPHSDPLEDRMRRGLQTDGWKLPADEAMLDRVHTGARRRRRRQQAGMALAAIAVVAGGVGGAGYATTYLKDDQSTTASQQDTATTNTTTPTPSTMLASPGSSEKSTEGRNTPESTVPPADETSEPRNEDKTTVRLKPVPAGFHAASLTATSAERFWVLGANGDNASVALTDDGGKNFGQVGAFDARVANDQTTDATTVHDVRFADDDNGWAYGNALWATNDGGQKWERTKGVPGEVERLEAENGRAYALARAGDSWSVWSTKAGSPTWQQLKVALSKPSDLAATNNTVAIADRTDDETYTMISEDAGQTFDKRPTPCAPDLSGGDLSASDGSLWLQCPTGTGSELLRSDDAGRQWDPVDTGGDAVSTNASAVGAQGKDGAVLAVPGEVRKVDGDQSATVPVEGLDTPTYSGFTTPEVGYIIDLQGNLFRTTNAGSDWNPVSVK
ncbi:WD40/YVTN/BNR-like repeat-containing protein [Flindersiella endophytica]